MSNLMDAIVTLACAGTAAATSIIMLNAGASPGLAGVTGIAIFGVASQLQNVGIRRRDRHALERELVALKRADLIVSDQVATTEERVQQILTAIHASHVEREGKLAAELKVVETLMRQFAESMVKRVQMVEAAQGAAAEEARRLAARIKSGPVSAPPAIAAEDGIADAQMLDLIQRSLIENRVDLHLQPVVSLPQRKLRFYEALSRLRTPEGALIMPAQYLKVAEAAGLMSTVDNLLLFRCVQFIRRLSARHRETGVFCNISAHSLRDAAFFPQFIDFMRAHRDLRDQIVFEFPQSAFAALTAEDEANLKELSKLGFAFSMDQVTSLSFNPETLRLAGVRFVKVPGRLLLNPDAEVAGGIRPEDFRELLARQGIALIGERIETERQVVDLLDFAIDYGQGYLFGEPRPLKDDQPETPRPPPREAATAAAAPPQQAGMTALFQARAPRRAAG